MQKQKSSAIVYNLVGALIHPYTIPPEFEKEFSRLRQKGKAGYREYDSRLIDLLLRGSVGIKPIDGAVEFLQRMHDNGLVNVVYSHSSEEHLRLTFETLGWNKLINAKYGTLDRPEIFDKEDPKSYGNLVRLMKKDGWNPDIYVTNKDREAIAASRTLCVFLITGGDAERRIHYFWSIGDIGKIGNLNKLNSLNRF